LDVSATVLVNRRAFFRGGLMAHKGKKLVSIEKKTVKTFDYLDTRAPKRPDGDDKDVAVRSHTRSAPEPEPKRRVFDGLRRKKDPEVEHAHAFHKSLERED